jgi:hypothetical protein
VAIDVLTFVGYVQSLSTIAILIEIPINQVDQSDIQRSRISGDDFVNWRGGDVPAENR